MGLEHIGPLGFGNFGPRLNGPLGLDLLGRGPGLDWTYFGLLGSLILDYLTGILAHFHFVGPADRWACLGGPPKSLLYLGLVGPDSGPPD